MTRSVFTDSYRVLTDFLRHARAAAGVSQTELARRLGKPQQFVSYFELGERRIDVVEFCAIVRALGISPIDAFREFSLLLPDHIDI